MKPAKMSQLTPAEYNPRAITDEALSGLGYSLSEFGDLSGIVMNERTGRLVCGHQRVKALTLSHGDLPIKKGAIVTPEGEEFKVRIVDWDETKEKAANIAANNYLIAGEFTEDLGDIIEELKDELPDLCEELRFDELVCDVLDAPKDEGPPNPPNQSLADRFGVPPFSVLDARQGYWQDRKLAWLAYGIQGETGREEGLLGSRMGYELMEKNEGSIRKQQGTSIFDPVLCELVYRWFCPDGGQVVDPFAGGSVRGIVASVLGREYVGIDLSERQIEANREQAAQICSGDNPAPVWIVGDSSNLASLVGSDLEADLVFSCPPYADLEVYSDDPADLSTMDYPAFREAYRGIIAAAVGKLKQDRFACLVVGEVRDKKGNYVGFVPDTIRAFEDAGARFYNEAILVTAVGSLPIRVGKQFQAGRKLGKTHQNVLVFVKGSAKKATEAVGVIEFNTAVDEPTP